MLAGIAFGHEEHLLALGVGLAGAILGHGESMVPPLQHFPGGISLRDAEGFEELGEDLEGHKEDGDKLLVNNLSVTVHVLLLVCQFLSKVGHLVSQVRR